MVAVCLLVNWLWRDSGLLMVSDLDTAEESLLLASVSISEPDQAKTQVPAGSL